MPVYHLDAIATQVRAAAKAGPVVVVAVDGRSGGGKTRLAKRIARALGPHVVLHTDAYVPGWDGLAEVPDLTRELLAPLRDGLASAYRRWDWIADQPGNVIDVQPVPYVVIEGCGSGSLAVADLIDFLIWVEVPADIRRTRALARDGETYEPHWKRWAAQEDELFARERTRERADLIIDGRAPVR